MTNVRHDAPITIHIQSGLAHYASNEPCSRPDDVKCCDYEHKTTARGVDTALAIEAIKHGKVSGHMSGVKCTYNLTLDDDSYELAAGQLCTCAECVPARNTLAADRP